MKGRKTMRDLLDSTLCCKDYDNANEKKCICLDQLPLAYAYVPFQNFNSTFNCDEALNKGTIFPELFKPRKVYGNEFNLIGRVD